MRSNNIFLFLIYKYSTKSRFIWRVLRKIILPLLNIYFKASDFITFITFNFLRSKQKSLYSKRIHIHTQAWGDYLDWFLKYNLPSLLQKDNLPKLKLEGYDIHFYIYTSLQDKARLLEDLKFKNLLKEISKYGELHINYFNLDDFEERNDIQIKNLIHFIKDCLIHKAYFLHSPPDIIFGNNSIFNGFKCIEGKNVCFSAPTARVALSKITSQKEIKDLENLGSIISNSKLVNLLFNSLHSEMEFAFDNKDNNTTFNTGVSIRSIDSNSYAVIHNIPSVFIGKFNFFDLTFFHLNYAFNDWDRKWSSLLLRTNRLKVCGSSDMFFLVELTKDKFKDPIFDMNMLHNDLKNEGLKLEHLIPNQFISFWSAK